MQNTSIKNTMHYFLANRNLTKLKHNDVLVQPSTFAGAMTETLAAGKPHKEIHGIRLKYAFMPVKIFFSFLFH